MACTQPRTLVVQNRPGIGDTVWHLRAFKALARAAPDGKISLLTRSQTQAKTWLDHEPWLDEVIYVDKEKDLGALGFLTLSQKIKQGRFQRIWILHHSPRYAHAAFLAEVPERFGYGLRNFHNIFLHNVLSPRVYRNLHPTQRFEVFLHHHGIGCLAEDHQLKPHPQALQEIQNDVGSHPHPWIVLGFGASDPLRQWPGERFAALAAHLSKPGENTIWLCGSQAEHDQALSIQRQVAAQGKEVVLATQYTIPQMIALLSLSQGFVGNDSGLFNLASALNIPAWGVFRDFGPRYYRHGLFGELYGGAESPPVRPLKDVSVEEVLHAIFSESKQKAA